MINPEQKELADYLKNVHLSLRRKSRQIGAEKAWEEHLQNEEVLRKYAFAMKKLAEEFWSANNQSETGIFLCRIEWIINYVIDYFQKQLIKNEFEKEFKRMVVFHKKGLIADYELYCYEEQTYDFQHRLKLLDVGSCYNPFKKFDFLEIYPIDLYPANSEVKKCNFIDSQIVNLADDWFQKNSNQIPANFFDVVVFSLFLEYLPSPKQRFIAYVNAYNCLKTNGLLLIVTPDSKHATANAVIMKKWKIGAAKIGFVRTKLEKLKYLYCMAFRKSVSPKYPSLLYKLSVENHSEEMFIIPQDSVNYKLVEELTEKKSESEEKELQELFEELPFV